MHQHKDVRRLMVSQLLSSHSRHRKLAASRCTFGILLNGGVLDSEERVGRGNSQHMHAKRAGVRRVVGVEESEEDVPNSAEFENSTPIRESSNATRRSNVQP